MTEEEALDRYQACGAIVPGHFVYTSGLHGDAYLLKDKLSQEIVKAFACELAWRLWIQNISPCIVIGPAHGGIVVSQWVGYYLSCLTGRKVKSMYAEKETVDGTPLWHISYGLNQLIPGFPVLGRAPYNHFVLKRGFDEAVSGHQVLVVEDNLTTGSSVSEVIDEVRAHEGEVIAVGAWWNRGGVTAVQVGDVPILESLINIKLPMWTPAECAQVGPCARGIPIDPHIGKGSKHP